MILRVLALFVTVLLLVGCSRGALELPPLPSDAVILAFGDSLTCGTAAGVGEGFAEVLAVSSGRAVVNAGVPGEESDAGLARLPESLDAVRPSLVILGTHPLYRELADELKVPLEDKVLADVLADRELKADQIHPNAAGYRQVARRFTGS